ncbi:MAG: hypothetical protein AB1410_04805 [Acidobacteriota bacterium]
MKRKKQKGQVSLEIIFTFLVLIVLMMAFVQIVLFGISQIWVNYAAFAVNRASLVGGDVNSVARQVLLGTFPGGFPRPDIFNQITLRKPQSGENSTIGIQVRFRMPAFISLAAGSTLPWPIGSDITIRSLFSIVPPTPEWARGNVSELPMGRATPDQVWTGDNKPD